MLQYYPEVAHEHFESGILNAEDNKELDE